PASPPSLTRRSSDLLDYDTQRLGPARCDWSKLGRELDEACAPLLDAANTSGAEVWLVNECSHVDVDRPILINRALADVGLLRSRSEEHTSELQSHLN